MSTEMGAKEQTIKDRAEEHLSLLRELVSCLDNLVERNRPDCEVKSLESPKPLEGNVFDEITGVMAKSGGLIREALEKVQCGIANKVC